MNTKKRCRADCFDPSNSLTAFQWEITYSCPECKGSGEVKDFIYDEILEDDILTTIQCPNCWGQGEVVDYR